MRKNCYFLGIHGKDSKSDYCLKKAGNQYTLKDKVHALTTPPRSRAIKLTDKIHKPRLNKKEKELIKELKEQASLRLLQLSRQKQLPRNAYPQLKSKERITICKGRGGRLIVKAGNECMISF